MSYVFGKKQHAFGEETTHNPPSQGAPDLRGGQVDGTFLFWPELEKSLHNSREEDVQSWCESCTHHSTHRLLSALASIPHSAGCPTTMHTVNMSAATDGTLRAYMGTYTWEASSAMDVAPFALSTITCGGVPVAGWVAGRRVSPLAWHGRCAAVRAHLTCP